MSKRIILGLLGLFLVAGVAAAQTYVRPSKGAVLALYSSPQNAPEPTTSSLYDWTSFYSANLIVTFASPTGGGCICPQATRNGQTRQQCTFTAPRFNIKGTADKTSPTFLDLFNIDGAGFMVFGNPATDGFAIGSINIQTPYIKTQFWAGSYTDFAGNPVVGYQCVMKVFSTPLPYPYQYLVEGAGVSFDNQRLISDPNPVISGGVSWWEDGINLPLNIDQGSGALMVRQQTMAKLNPASEAVVTVPQYAKACATDADCGNTGGYISSCIAGACSVSMVALAAGYPQSGVRLQNVGVKPALCAAGENANALSTTRYSFVLKADTAAGAGGGGVIDLPTAYSNDDAKRKVYCTGSGGDTTITVMPY